MLRRTTTLLVVIGALALGSVGAAGADPPAGCPGSFTGPTPITKVPEPIVGWTTNAPVSEPPLVCYRTQDTGNGSLSIVIPSR